MGTHAIFESDFDCLTVIRNGFRMECGHLILFVGAAGYIGFAVAQKLSDDPKKRRVNGKIQLDEDKIVHIYESDKMADKEVYCRCWKSKKFPYCDGAHNAHNKLTGDNVGPLIIKKS